MRKKIIVVTGLPGSGKSIVADEIKAKKIPTLYTAKIIRDEISKRGLVLSVESAEYMAQELRKQYGSEAPTRLVEHKIDSMKSKVICISGPRSVKEVTYLKLFGDVYLIIVESASRTRFSRLKARASPSDPEKWDKFLWQDKRELKRGMKSLTGTKKFRKFIIKNTGTVSELKKKAISVLEEIKSDKNCCGRGNKSCCKVGKK